MDANTLNEITAILTLFNGVAPAGISLIKSLATSLQGKTDAEILAEADSLYQSVIDRAKAELSALPQPPASPDAPSA